MRSIYKILTLAPTIAFMADTVSAQVVRANITLELLEAPNTADFGIGDIFTTAISYDSSLLIGDDQENLSIGHGLLSISFSFNGHMYDHTYDIAPGFPKIYFSNSRLSGIDYWNSLGIQNSNPRSFFRFFKDGSFNYSPSGESEYLGRYVISSSTPEVSSTALLLAASSVIIFKRNR